MRALQIMKNAKTVNSRASSYYKSAKKTVEFEVIQKLQRKLEEMEDKIFNEEDFTLQTDLNKGKAAISREECEKRFISLIEMRYEIKLLSLELETKKEAYEIYFGGDIEVDESDVKEKD